MSDRARPVGGPDRVKSWRGPDLAKGWGGPAKVPTVDELRDHHAVSQLPKIYALGIDLYDPELCRSAFSDDAAAGGEAGELTPIDEYLEALQHEIGSYESTQHIVAQQHIRLDGDAAEMWSYGLGVKDQKVVAGYWYRDVCRREEKGWLITERRTYVQWVDAASMFG